MKVLVTGHNGFIGSVLTPMLVEVGHDVTGLDTFYFEACTYGDADEEPDSIRKDVRDVAAADLEGFEAVIHLAALSNDPLGDLRAKVTQDVNHDATVRLAALAKEAGVARFVFSSSCSLYGASSGSNLLDEEAPFNPVTPYGESKVWSERDVVLLADDNFSPTFLRNATVYGMSPRLRGDVVVNNLVGYAFATGEVLLKSDGSQWRPLVHVADICRAFLAVLDAPRDLVHREAFNVGSTDQNLQIRDVARTVGEVVADSLVVTAPGADPDQRNYRVNCDKIAERLGYRTSWTVEEGAREVFEAFAHHGLVLEQLNGPALQRLARIKELLNNGSLDPDLRWRPGASTARSSESSTTPD